MDDFNYKSYQMANGSVKGLRIQQKKAKQNPRTEIACFLI